jgi:hypothetical protein
MRTCTALLLLIALTAGVAIDLPELAHFLGSAVAQDRGPALARSQGRAPLSWRGWGCVYAQEAEEEEMEEEEQSAPPFQFAITIWTVLIVVLLLNATLLLHLYSAYRKKRLQAAANPESRK